MAVDVTGYKIINADYHGGEGHDRYILLGHRADKYVERNLN